MQFIIDMDGVLYRGNKKIEGADRFIQFLQENNIPFILATNNSTKTRKMFSEKLEKMGMHVEPERIITSSYVTAEILRWERKKSRAFVIGCAGIYDELERIGWGIVEMKEWREAEYVIVGMDLELTYEKLKYGCLAINKGARFVATNDDKNFPSEEGLIPGAGSMIAALEPATGKKAKVMGKPNDPYVRIIKKVLPGGDYYVVGDRVETDMLLAEKLGAKKILVLSGVSREGRADMVVESVAELPDILSGYLS